MGDENSNSNSNTTGAESNANQPGFVTLQRNEPPNIPQSHWPSHSDLLNVEQLVIDYLLAERQMDYYDELHEQLDAQADMALLSLTIDSETGAVAPGELKTYHQHARQAMQALQAWRQARYRWLQIEKRLPALLGTWPDSWARIYTWRPPALYGSWLDKVKANLDAIHAQLAAVPQPEGGVDSAPDWKELADDLEETKTKPPKEHYAAVARMDGTVSSPQTFDQRADQVVEFVYADTLGAKTGMEPVALTNIIYWAYHPKHIVQPATQRSDLTLFDYDQLDNQRRYKHVDQMPQAHSFSQKMAFAKYENLHYDWPIGAGQTTRDGHLVRYDPQNAGREHRGISQHRLADFLGADTTITATSLQATPPSSATQAPSGPSSIARAAEILPHADTMRARLPQYMAWWGNQHHPDSSEYRFAALLHGRTDLSYNNDLLPNDLTYGFMAYPLQYGEVKTGDVLALSQVKVPHTKQYLTHADPLPKDVRPIPLHCPLPAWWNRLQQRLDDLQVTHAAHYTRLEIIARDLALVKYLKDTVGAHTQWPYEAGANAYGISDELMRRETVASNFSIMHQHLEQLFAEAVMEDQGQALHPDDQAAVDQAKALQKFINRQAFTQELLTYLKHYRQQLPAGQLNLCWFTPSPGPYLPVEPCLAPMYDQLARSYEALAEYDELRQEVFDNDIKPVLDYLLERPGWGEQFSHAIKQLSEDVIVRELDNKTKLSEATIILQIQALAKGYVPETGATPAPRPTNPLGELLCAHIDLLELNPQLILKDFGRQGMYLDGSPVTLLSRVLEAFSEEIFNLMQQTAAQDSFGNRSMALLMSQFWFSGWLSEPKLLPKIIAGLWQPNGNLRAAQVSISQTISNMVDELQSSEGYDSIVDEIISKAEGKVEAKLKKSSIGVVRMLYNTYTYCSALHKLAIGTAEDIATLQKETDSTEHMLAMLEVMTDLGKASNTIIAFSMVMGNEIEALYANDPKKKLTQLKKFKKKLTAWGKLLGKKALPLLGAIAGSFETLIIWRDDKETAEAAAWATVIATRDWLILAGPLMHNTGKILLLNTAATALPKDLLEKKVARMLARRLAARVGFGIAAAVGFGLTGVGLLMSVIMIIWTIGEFIVAVAQIVDAMDWLRSVDEGNVRELWEQFKLSPQFSTYKKHTGMRLNIRNVDKYIDVFLVSDLPLHHLSWHAMIPLTVTGRPPELLDDVVKFRASVIPATSPNNPNTHLQPRTRYDGNIINTHAQLTEFWNYIRDPDRVDQTFGKLNRGNGQYVTVTYAEVVTALLSGTFRAPPAQHIVDPKVRAWLDHASLRAGAHPHGFVAAYHAQQVAEKLDMQAAGLTSTEVLINRHPI